MSDTPGLIGRAASPWLWLAAVCCAFAVSACGGASGGSGGGGGPAPPGPPTGLLINAGDRAISLAWTAPVSDGGAPITAYSVTLQPSAGTVAAVNGNTAVVTGLTDGVAYTVSVNAVNSVGSGPASAPAQATPSAAVPAAYTVLPISGDPAGVSGAFDPSVVAASGSTVWLAYSSAHYYPDGAGHTVQDVSTSIAKSADSGQTYAYVQTVGAAQGPVTVTDATHGLCGQSTCTGRWIYEVPFLVHDAADPDPSRAYKLFAHKYFLYPPSPPGTVPALGSIVMWTAGAPDGAWSAEQTVLTWNNTPPELAGGVNINGLDPALGPCLVLTEGAASVFGGSLDLVFNCTYPSGSAFLAKVVLLRSADHAKTFTYVSTLLTPADAAIAPGAAFFNAPALIPSAGGAPVLIATPDNGAGTYMGCLVIPFASEAAGTLIRDTQNRPVPIAVLATLGGHFGGACAWDRSAAGGGILMDDLNLGAPQPFRMLATHKTF